MLKANRSPVWPPPPDLALLCNAGLARAESSAAPLGTAPSISASVVIPPDWPQVNARVRQTGAFRLAGKLFREVRPQGRVCPVSRQQNVAARDFLFAEEVGIVDRHSADFLQLQLRNQTEHLTHVRR